VLKTSFKRTTAIPGRDWQRADPRLSQSLAQRVSLADLKFFQYLSQGSKALHYPAFVFGSRMAAIQPDQTAGAIMTIGEVAAFLKVTERTIYRLAGAKKIPSFKVGGSWRFSRVDIDRWIREQSMNSQPETGNSSS
jgi:excisionase family DNA binding protein